MKNLSLFLLFLILGTSFLNAQENQKLDSLVRLLEKEEGKSKADLLNEIIQIELYSRPVAVKTRINELIELSKTEGYRKGEAQGYYRKGGYFLNQGALDSAEHYHNKSLQINTEIKNTIGILNNNVAIAIIFMEQSRFDMAHKYLNQNVLLYNQRDTLKENGDFKFIGSTFHTISHVYSEQGMYNLSLENELKALKLYKLVNDELYIADALNSLGDVETELNNYQQALEYFEEAYQIYEKQGDIYFQIIALNNIGNSHYNMKDYQKAIDIFKKGIEISKKNKFKINEARFWVNLGNCHEKMNNIPLAINCQKKSIEMHKELNHLNDKLNAYVNIGNLYRKDGDYKKSTNFLNKVISDAEPNGLIKVAALAYDFRSKLHNDQGQFDLALNDYKMLVKLKDSMFNKTKSQQIEELRTIYDTEKKEQQIALQEKEITVLEQQAEISTLQKILLGGGLVLSLIGFYGIRQKLKRNKLEKEKVDAELAFKKKELTTHALHLAKKNEVLEGLKQQAQELKENETSKKGYQQLIRTINFDLQDDNNWENFSRYFEEVHKDFNRNVKTKYPQVTSNELRLMALLKMNLSSKEIANILNISQEGIKKARYRLRKKLDIATEDSLQDLVLSL
ncbi:tetratricopeptide repeat protein [Flagellimonas sp.]|uniref:tetratricopeptide repeat protein n=1 Tax=Flagellimonas sp. TaxID=2058762 RepID=UPI003F49F97F